jgi:hypothetical protein
MEAIDSDPMYGPRHDRDRSEIGVEYEVLLEKSLNDIGECDGLVLIYACS